MTRYSKAKEMWNRLRLVDLENSERDLLVLKLMKLLSGKVVDISLKHDGSRIIQTLYKYGTPEQRSAMTKVRTGSFSHAQELLKSVVPISKTKHGRFLIISMLRYGSKKDIEDFLEAIRGKLRGMIMHQVASVRLLSLFHVQHVIEYAYEEILTARQSFLLFEVVILSFVHAKEIYHRQYANVKDTEAQSITDIVKKNPILKDRIIENLFTVITKIVPLLFLGHT